MTRLDAMRMPVESWLAIPGHLFIVLFKCFPLDDLESENKSVCARETETQRQRRTDKRTQR